MKTIGIISEYNPFHKGHAYQLNQLAKQEPLSLRIAIMSGSFVQRGEPAYFSKFDRARWAILGGADVVIELPTIFSLGSAEIFSTGAVRLLHALHINAISFGTEVPDTTLLTNAAKLLSSTAGQESIKSLIDTGVSYGAALRQVLINTLPDGHLIATAPNAILGLEYIRSALSYHPNLTVIPIHRHSFHHDVALPQENALPSGTALRQALIDKAPIDPYIPDPIADDMNKAIANGHYVDYNRYKDYLLACNRMLSLEQLEQYGDFTEGIEHRWYTAMHNTNWDGALASIKTKRYTYARLQRMAAYTALGITKTILKQAHAEGPQYGRLLAFNTRGREWLKQHKQYSKDNPQAFPIINKWAQPPTNLSPLGNMMMHIDQKATDLQVFSFANKEKRQGAQDFIYSPQYINI